MAVMALLVFVEKNMLPVAVPTVEMAGMAVVFILSLTPSLIL